MPARWQLSRAGIVNVYQYEHEVLEFAGGRLLLRGVNGSGKSTAMNMLLPFLVTAHQGRIDAAGEQSGILKSWMLAGREDPQPVGYLWIEFARATSEGTEYTVCGCGIKANRQADTVTTWWFVTDLRPNLDVHLVEGGAALSVDALRAVLGHDAVYPEGRRRDYRADVERRLFGGTSIDQHIGLINVVRSPRVGDRIDVDLPLHLRDALPQLSEQALAEAAQPLDDLDDHRRNVAELARTREAVTGLLDVYRGYCAADLQGRVTTGRELAERARVAGRDLDRARKAATAAAGRVGELEATISELTGAEGTLRGEIAALKESDAYRAGQELDGIRGLLREQRRHADEASQLSERATAAEVRSVAALVTAEGTARRDHADLNEVLASVTSEAVACGLGERGPGPVTLADSPLADVAASEPGPAPDGDTLRAALARVTTGAAGRRADVDDVMRRRAAVDRAERQLEAADLRVADATARATAAGLSRDESFAALAERRREWAHAAAAWVAELAPDEAAAGLAAPEPGTDDPDAHEEQRRAVLLSRADALIGAREAALASADAALSERREAAADAQRLVDELATRSEPEVPRLAWQHDSDHCLADLVDFADALDDVERAGVEAALEASGLLAARVTADGSAELAGGDLVAVVAGGVAAPLSELLRVTVPDRLVGQVDPGLVAKLLDSVSHDVDSTAATVVATDGTFRVGALRGRHAKLAAEHVGVTARRSALERARVEAAERLAEATAVAEHAERNRAAAQAARDAARALRTALPETVAIQQARAAYAQAERAAEYATAEQEQATDAYRAADAAFAAASAELHRVATSLGLPTEATALDDVRQALVDLDRTVTDGRSRVAVLVRSVEAWRGAVERWHDDAAEADRARRACTSAEQRRDETQARLATIEDAIGLEYAEVVATLEHCEAELEGVGQRLVAARDEHTDAIETRATAVAGAQSAESASRAVEAECDQFGQTLTDVVALPGVFAALTSAHEAPPEPPALLSPGAAGLTAYLDALEALHLPVPAVPASADGVRQSLNQRRDALGAGWDAEARQPDPQRPLVIEVNGPTGRSPLPAAAQAIADQHRQLAGLLNSKQDAALRELLQGLIAREVAEKVHGAGELIERMNARLEAVTTTHEIGVRLRWRRSGDLDPPTARMAELLATLPDLRTDDDEQELRALLSARLDEARRLHPDLPYRQLIGATLDYKQWHALTVLVRRGAAETPLGRRTELSEGEKKLVTYVPLFAAVAASYDALAARAAAPGEPPVGVARFILLDDAFAKVSEDNHAKLFGLLVDLDLDLIATSERLWGTHRNVPELAITEVVRDAAAGVILLERYRWDGYTLERTGE